MSYDAAIESARALAATATPPAWAHVEAAARWSGAGRSGRTRALAAFASLAAAAVMAADAVVARNLGAPIVAVLGLPVVMLALAAVLVVREGLGAQLLARASWWSYLALGVVWSFGPAEALPAAGALLATCTGVALLAAGRGGTVRGDTRSGFDPLAFRGVVLLAMILAIAQAQLLALVAALRLESATATAATAWLPALALATVVGVIGLHRLQLWGLLALPAVALSSLAVLALGLVPLGPLLRISLAALALVQVVLPLPVLLAIRRGAGPVARAQELPHRAPAVVVVVLVLAAIVAGVLGSAP
jgi:hypothetical protein